VVSGPKEKSEWAFRPKNGGIKAKAVLQRIRVVFGVETDIILFTLGAFVRTFFPLWLNIN
jgi:hypothetical protein